MLSSRTRGALGLGTAVGVIIFVVGIFTAGAFFPGYNHLEQMISELGGVDASRPWIQNANFILFGFFNIALAFALGSGVPRLRAASLLLGCLGLFGTVFEGVAHCDSGCQGRTPEGAIHLASGLFGFVCGVISLFLFARQWKADPAWSAHSVTTRWCARAALAGLFLFIACNALQATKVDGLAQRIFVTPLLVWCFLTGLRLFQRRSLAS